MTKHEFREKAQVSGIGCDLQCTAPNYVQFWVWPQGWRNEIPVLPHIEVMGVEVYMNGKPYQSLSQAFEHVKNLLK